MSRNERIVRLVAAVAGIVAIALAAATVRSPLETGGSGGVGTGEGTGVGTGQPPPTEPADAGEVPAFLEYLVYGLVVVLAVVLVWYLIAHRRDAVRLIAIGLVVGLVVALLGAAIMQAAPYLAGEQGEPTERPGAPDEGGETGTGDGDDGRPVSIGPLLAVLALVTAVFVGGLLVSRRPDAGPGGTDPPDAVDRPDDDREAAAVGSAAGRAADRIDEGTAVDNEVYRAWREMTELLEVDRPDSTTPREFAGAAVDAGLEREHVDELTRLFEDVRYGHAETTSAMEDRARSVLRRIEAEYADDGVQGAGEYPAPDRDPDGGDSR